jgi:polysaccharide biosynthesis protein PslH
LQHGSHLMIADEPDTFANACLGLLRDEAERRRLANTARALISSRYSWETVSEAFERCLGW